MSAKFSQAGNDNILFDFFQSPSSNGDCMIVLLHVPLSLRIHSPAKLFRQISHLDFLTIANNQSIFQHIGQLPHIAGERMFHQNLLHLRRNCNHWFILFFGILSDEIITKAMDIILPFPQGRYMNANHTFENIQDQLSNSLMLKNFCDLDFVKDKNNLYQQAKEEQENELE